MFDRDALLDALVRAADETEPRRAVREALGAALRRSARRPEGVATALRQAGPDTTATVGDDGIIVLHREPGLTVLHVERPAGLRLWPHDHRLWAVIGVYAGREDHTLYHRSRVHHGRLAGPVSRRLAAGEVLVLGDDTIHAVDNIGDRPAGAIHVYGGDLLAQRRSQWWPGPFEERPFDLDGARQQFAAAGAGLVPGC